MRISQPARILLALSVPVLYAVVLRLVFGIDTGWGLFTVMSVSFLFLLPLMVGALTVYFSPKEQVQKYWYRAFAPWIPIFLFLFLTIALAWEGWACWLMILPLFLAFATIGGFIGASFKLRKKDNTVYISVLALLPLLIAPLEAWIGAVPGTYEAHSYIDIHAPAGKIWDNITRVRAIPAAQDKGYLTAFLGFPRPVEAILNYEGLGATREARFTKGLVFHEKVLEYDPGKKMVFSIKACPYEIPSTTMDEHVVIGGNYFDVLTGTYELEKLDGHTYRLHLYSHFKLTTTFNFYASWWARLIMQDIQNNILQVEKERAENE